MNIHLNEIFSLAFCSSNAPKSRSWRREENPNPEMWRHEANEPERGCVGVGDQPQRVDLAAIQNAAADAPAPHTAALRDTVRWQAEQNCVARDRSEGAWFNVRLALVLLFAVLIAGCGKPAGPTPGSSTSPAPNRATNAITANTTINAPANEAMLQKAIFEDRPEGRDPFFPHSSRRKQAAVQAVGEAPKPKLPLSSYLKLTGMVTIRNEPSAWINGYMFKPGERGIAKVSFTNTHNIVEVQDVHLRCLEIRKNSVVIRVEGESGDTVLRVP